MRWLIALCIVVLCIGCLSDGTDKTAGPQQAALIVPEPDFVVFLTGDTLSTLKPCGCAEGQLGGFDRRKAVLDSVPRQKRLVIDTGNLLEAESEQDLIKFSIIFQALAMLEYDLVNLSEDDLRVAQDLQMIDVSDFDLISPLPGQGQLSSAFSREFQSAGNGLTINVVSADTQSGRLLDSLEQFLPVPAGQVWLNILIVNNCDPDIIEQVRSADLVDVMVCPSIDDQPRVIPGQYEKPLMITAGRLGKYVGRLAVVFDDEALKLEYTSEMVNETLPSNPALVRLYKDYQSIVKNERLLEKYPRAPLPDELEYLGSNSCSLAPCHKYEFDIWATRPHAIAYQTLVNVGSEYDPECINCHVVGFDYESGFLNEQSPEDLRDVGCEICHGPGSRHMIAVMMEQENTATDEPKFDCINCHTPDHSPDYAANEELFLEKIRHWREQKDKNGVK